VMSCHLMRHLKNRKDIELSAILLNEGRLAEEIRNLGIPVDVVDEKTRNIMRLSLDIRKICVRRSIDVMHSHRYKENILAYVATKFLKGIRLVGTQHGMPEFLGANRNPKYRLLHRLNIVLLSKSFGRVVAVSSDIKGILLKNFSFPVDKLSVILNGADIPDRAPSRNGKEHFIVGSMGRFFPVKDYPLMVEIAREVSFATEKIRFELAGDGPEKRTITDAVERNQLDGVFHLKGTVEDLDGFYRGIDLYLNTSVHEGIPISVLEAMSYGIPVIASNVGGLREMMEDGKEGFLVDGRDPKEFARKCLCLFEDRDMLRRMGSWAREKVERDFSNESMAREYHRMYREIFGETVVGGDA
jgi:glycosyltransferase involved in cell wall biosynthesis